MPTLRQRKAVKAIVENGGIVSKGMEAAGYTKATAKTPQKLTNSKGWAELLEEALPDSLLSKVHKKLLAKKEKIVVGVGNGYSEIRITGEPHSDTLRALEMGYRLKARFIDRTDITSGGKPIQIDISEAIAKKNDINTSAESNSGRLAPV